MAITTDSRRPGSPSSMSPVSGAPCCGAGVS